MAWAHDWHIREETYAAGLARLIDFHCAMPLAQLWGTGATSSSDGQYYRAGGHGEAFGDINAHHGNEPGVAFYTHISDQFGPYYTKVIAATASEAPHVLDGLLYHQTGLRIEEHYTDTGGITDHLFGLCPLFGFRFAARIRDLKDRRLYLFPGQNAPPILEPIVGGYIDHDHIAAHWDDVLRLGTSIRAGTVTASAILMTHEAFDAATARRVPQPAQARVNPRRIQAIMPQRFRVCATDSRHDLPAAPNRLGQKFAAERPNQVGLPI